MLRGRDERKGTLTLKSTVTLINDAIRKNVLSGSKDNFVMVYRQQDGEMPEGWYISDIYDMAKNLVEDNSMAEILRELIK